MAQQEEKKEVNDKDDTLKLLDLVESAFKKGHRLESIPEGICGRFQKYSDKQLKGDNVKNLAKPYKYFAWIFGGDGIYNLSLLNSNLSKLFYVGYSNEWIKRNIMEKNAKFRLLLFPSKDNDALCATWDNVFILLQKYVNDAYIRIKKYIQQIKNTPLREIEKNAGFSFMDIHLLGPTKSDKFMSLERFTKIDIDKVTLIQSRLFLYNWLGINHLFSGKGYTLCEDNDKQDKGCLEYLMPNKLIKEIPHIRIIELDIDTNELK